jgi:hypothetical protein
MHVCMNVRIYVCVVYQNPSGVSLCMYAFVALCMDVSSAFGGLQLCLCLSLEMLPRFGELSLYICMYVCMHVCINMYVCT